MSTGETTTGRHILEGLGETTRPAWLTPESIASVEAAEELPFPVAEYSGRLRGVRERMLELDVEAMLVFRPSSVEYLCGYHSAETMPQPLLVTRTQTFLYVPDLEVGRALASSCADSILYYDYAAAPHGQDPVVSHLAHVLPDGARVAVELGQTSTPPRIVDFLAKEGHTPIDGNYLVERLRLVLSPAEIKFVETAADRTQEGVEAAVEAARRTDATDSAIAGAIASALFTGANSASAWGPVVATGQRGGIAHSSWKQQPLSEGATFLEFAGAHHRYHAPVMRTLCRSRPSVDALRLAELSKTALAAVLDSAEPGVPCAEVAAQAKAALGQPDSDVQFHQLFGYPVGLAHPPHWMDGIPFHITVDNPAPLREGMVFHMPGSFRSFGTMGVGLSQTFVVEATGTRVLTRGPAELIEL